MSKSVIRKELLNIRNNLANKDALSKIINLKVIDFIDTLDEKNPKLKIASFLSLPNEISTSIINSSFEVYLPIVHPTIKHGLWFVKNNGNYYKNKFNIKEPYYKSTDIIAPWELDVLIVPIVGFNNDKYRMGMGGGFYDYSLSFKKPHKNPITIGIAFDEQQNNDIIIDSYDIQLDLIITPTRIL
ncbi:5-formyltetrahydrofolate cyclo-ligase [Francisellaceae bacterium CB300]|jgi:5-formyltetrahydrofolate cyclo-ligase